MLHRVATLRSSARDTALRLAALSILSLGSASCASTPRAVRYPVPPSALDQTVPATREFALSVPPPSGDRPPRVVIPAPPLAPPSAQATAESAPVEPNGASARPRVWTPFAPPAAAQSAPFTPQASPLLAAFDSKPRGQPPRTEPYVEELERARAARSSRTYSGWSSAYPPAYYSYPAYPYYGANAYSYAPYRGFGAGIGLGLGLGFGLGRGFGYGHHHHHGFRGHGHRPFGHRR
jgi:hypothetical protein